MPPAHLDIITMGRSSVDLYAQQIGTRLEDSETFKKAVGGCPSNIAIGCARLGLKTGIITAVGDEQFGNYIVEEFSRHQIDLTGIKTDPNRLTALAILSIKDAENFPLLFYRENCADMGLDENDVDENFVATARALLVSGTHFSKPNVERAQTKAIRAAKSAGRQVIFDIDFRPNLWGLAGHASGDERFIQAPAVSEKFQEILPHCDVIVGTEEEICIAGGHSSSIASLKHIREFTNGLIVVKRGPLGSSAFTGVIPESLDNAIHGKSFAITVLNVLGAGDAFMAGFLHGYLSGAEISESLSIGNACGAVVVSRLMCSSEIPGLREIKAFMENGSDTMNVRTNARLNHLHWVEHRAPEPHSLSVLALDHWRQLEELADIAKVPQQKISQFKALALDAAITVANGQPDFGVILDEASSSDAFTKATIANLWIARPVEKPGSHSLDFEYDGDVGTQLIEWPVHHVIKCLYHFNTDDHDDFRLYQERKTRRIFDATRLTGHKLLLEIKSNNHDQLTSTTTADAMSRLYDIGIFPDWWKLESQNSKQPWSNISALVKSYDPDCLGIIASGMNASLKQIENALELAAGEPMVRGFTIHAAIFNTLAEDWINGTISSQEACENMAEIFRSLTNSWAIYRRRVSHS